MDTIAPGIRPGSDTAHLALLGYDPHKYYTGRGPLECEGTGIHMEPGMIGFRCNYATISKDGIITDRRAGRIHDTAALSAAIQEGVDLSRYGVEFIVPVRSRTPGRPRPEGKGLGHCVSSNDPKKEGGDTSQGQANSSRRRSTRRPPMSATSSSNSPRRSFSIIP